MKHIIPFIIFLLLGFQLSAQDNEQIVRLAKLQIDSLQMDNYNAALKTEIETSIQVKSGVLMLHAVAEK